VDVRTIRVRFAGEGSGEAPLTWSQADHWRAISAAGRAATFGGAFEMPAETTVSGAVELLRYLVGRHQALRTRLAFDADGEPRQVCVEAGEIELLVVGPDTDPDELYRRLADQPFDYRQDWPIRLAVVADGERVRHLVVVYLHLAVDGGGIEALLADLAARDPGTGAAAGPVTAVQPLALARRQAEPAAQRQSSAAMRYLERVLRSAPAELLGEPGPGPADYRAIRYTSPAAALAVPVAATALGVPPASVLSAAVAVGLARRLGTGTVWAMMLVSNRFRPGLTDSVGLIVQSSPFLLDLGGISLAEAAARARTSLLLCYKNAYYDGRHRDALLARLTAELGRDPVRDCCYVNDRRRDRPVGPDAADRLPDVLHAGRWQLEDRPAADLPALPLMVNVEDVPGDQPALALPISFDTRYLSIDDALALARGIETAAVELAVSPQVPTGVGTYLPAGQPA